MAPSDTRELKKGSAELLILSLIESRPRHGYDIARLIELRSEGAITFNAASLYPLLSRLERGGWIEGRWVEKAGERRRRFYSLTAEGRRFTVFTPAGSVRLASDASGEDFIELSLDASQDPPRVLGRTSRGRGRRMVTTERPLDPAVADLTDEDVLEFLLSEIVPFVGR